MYKKVKSDWELKSISHCSYVDTFCTSTSIDVSLAEAASRFWHK